MSVQKYYTEIDITTPPGVLQSAPLVTQINLGDVMLHQIDMRIPPGHNGFTGIQIKLSDNAIVPWGNASAFIVGNDESLKFEYGDEVDAGLTVVTFNIGTYAHTHYLRFINTPISLAQSEAPIVKPVVIV